MSVSISAVQIAGGAILFMMAIKMIFPSKPTDDSNNSTDPLIIPLATPIMAGPSSIAMTMIIAGHQDIKIDTPGKPGVLRQQSCQLLQIKLDL